MMRSPISFSVRSCSIFLSVVAAASSLSACAGKDFFDTIAITAVTDEQKETLLREQLTKFNRAVYWGTTSEVSGFLAPQIRSQFMQEEFERRDKQRMVNSDIINVDVHPLEDLANVQLLIKYYEQPRYIVVTRKENQEWKFDRFAKGWKLVSRTYETASEPGSDVSPTRARYAPSVMTER